MPSELELFRLAQNDSSLRERFLVKKQKLVKKICYQYCGVVDDDMLQEGNIGLMVAFDRFDPDMGFKFDTYAKNWVFSYIQQYNWKKHVVRIGRRLRAKRLQEGGETTIPTVSLDYRSEDGEFLEIADDSLGIEDIIQKDHDIYFVQKFVRDIESDRSREMVKAYYGLEDEKPINMTALSSIYNLSKQRCQQIISKEIRKMREMYSTIDS